MVDYLSCCCCFESLISCTGSYACLDVPLCDVYKTVREKVENERPELVNKMTATLGFVLILSSSRRIAERRWDFFRTALGIEFRESTIAITSKCTTKAQKGKLTAQGMLDARSTCSGMTFQISIGFAGLENPDGKDGQSKTYALFIGDTVLVNEVNTNDACSSNDSPISLLE